MNSRVQQCQVANSNKAVRKLRAQGSQEEEWNPQD